MNDAEIMELVDEVRRCERAVQQAKNALEVAKRDAAVAACPYKEGDIVSGWDRDGTSPAKVDKILFVPSYPYYDLRDVNRRVDAFTTQVARIGMPGPQVNFFRYVEGQGFDMGLEK